jgi:hypothetical protein
MPTPRRRPRDVRRGVVVRDLVVAGLVLALVAGCGVDDGAVEEVTALPGVAWASSSCELSGCTLHVGLSEDVDADRLAAVLGGAREVGADRISVREDEDPDEEPPRVAVDLDEDSDPSADRAVAELVASSLALPGVRSWGLERDRDGRSRLTASLDPIGAGEGGDSDGGDGPTATTGRDLWAGVATLPRPGMVLTTAGSDGSGPSRLVASGTYPERAVRLADDLASRFGADRLTGVDVRADEVRLGVRTAEDARALEALAARPGVSDGVDVDVVVASNVLAAPQRSVAGRDEDLGTEEDRRALLDALAGQPGVRASVDGWTVEVQQEGTLAAVRDALASARREASDAFARVPVTVLTDAPGDPGNPRSREVQLGTSGDLGLLDLVADLEALDGTLAAGVRQPVAGSSGREPTISVTARRAGIDGAAGIDGLVRDTAATFAAWDEGPSALVVVMTVVDPELRRATTVLRVDRSGGTWTATSAGRGTEESVAEGLRAWRSAG